MSVALSSPVARRPLHTRTLAMDCYLREDGLLEVEAHLRDTKPFALKMGGERERPPGAPIHDMWLRLRLDDSLTILGVEAAMPTGAHDSCTGAVPAYEKLVGLQVGVGWVREARHRVGVAAGCTHLTEMLHQMGTTAMQGFYGLRQQRRGPEASIEPIHPRLLDTCFGLRAGGEVDRLRSRR
ncbi:MAG: DUF2889 domain-containing protein [Alphaproteobacteria bacterium]|nr:DUF2889 domain-containing protein [Alphaproteobacteria bacterium]